MPQPLVLSDARYAPICRHCGRRDAQFPQVRPGSFPFQFEGTEVLCRLFRPYGLRLRSQSFYAVRQCSERLRRHRRHRQHQVTRLRSEHCPGRFLYNDRVLPRHAPFLSAPGHWFIGPHHRDNLDSSSFPIRDDHGPDISTFRIWCCAFDLIFPIRFLRSLMGRHVNETVSKKIIEIADQQIAICELIQCMFRIGQSKFGTSNRTNSLGSLRGCPWLRHLDQGNGLTYHGDR
jgi:hypothetical protein